MDIVYIDTVIHPHATHKRQMLIEKEQKHMPHGAGTSTRTTGLFSG
jgi:hypothetical protein